MAKFYHLEIRIENDHGHHPDYRLWIDGELMCERTFWLEGDKFYIDENCAVKLTEGKHRAILELLRRKPGRCQVLRLIVNDIETKTNAIFKPQAVDGRHQVIDFTC